jgi:hypothetical protein
MRLQFRVPGRKNPYEMNAKDILDQYVIDDPLDYSEIIKQAIADFMSQNVSQYSEHKVRVVGNRYILVSDKID